MANLVPVEHDPFAAAATPAATPAGAKLVPVDHDPFSNPAAGGPNVAEQLAKLGIPAPGTPSSATPAPRDPVLDAVMTAGSAARQGGIALSEGATNFAGLPVGIINAIPMLANLLPGVDNVGPISSKPVMGRDWLRDVFALDRAPEPANMGERVIRRVGQEVGAAAVPAAGIAAKAAQVGVEGARQMGPIARMFVEPAAVAPARTAVREARAAVAAGTGAAGAHEALGQRDPNTTGYQVADLLGALGGVTALGVTTGVAPKLLEVGKAVTGTAGYVDDVVKNAVVDQLATNAGAPKVATGRGREAYDTDTIVQAIENGRHVGDTVPGYQESLADRTRSPQIAALEYSRQTGPNSGLFTARREENTAAIDEALNRSRPDGSPGALRSELELERDRRTTDAQVRALNAEDEATRATQGLTPQTTPEARGNVVRTALEEARDAARQNTEQAYDALGINGREVDPRPLSEALDTNLNALTQTERDLVPEGLVARVRNLGRAEEVDTGLVDPSGRPITRAAEPDPVALKEATDLYSELGRRAAAAAADPRAERGGRNAARVLNPLRQTVDTFVAGHLPEAELAAARGAKAAEAEAFTRPGDPVAAALARQEGGQPRMVNERVAGTFVRPEAMDRLFAQADTPDVRAAIRDEVLSRGRMDTPENIQRFMQEYGQQIDRFPGLRQDITRAAEARTAETGARTDFQNILRDLGDPDTGVPGRSTVGQYLRYGDENADRAMRGVLNSAKPGEAVDELLRFVNDDPAAVDGARKVFWDIMQKQGRSRGETTAGTRDVQPWLPKRLSNFINDPRNAAVAERLYRDNPEHWQNVKTITEAVQGLDLRNTARAANTSGTAQSTNNVLTPETLQSRLYAWQRGQISGSFLATSLVAVAARRSVKAAQGKAIGEMLDKALLNPDVAAALLKENNPANLAALRRNAKTWLGNEASTFLELVTPDEDDKVKEAVGRK